MTSIEAKLLWEATLELLRGDMPGYSYDLWLKPIELI